MQSHHGGNLECHDTAGDEKPVSNGVEVAFAGLRKVVGDEGPDAGLVAQRRVRERPLRGGREAAVSQQVVISQAVSRQ